MESEWRGCSLKQQNVCEVWLVISYQKNGNRNEKNGSKKKKGNNTENENSIAGFFGRVIPRTQQYVFPHVKLILKC